MKHGKQPIPGEGEFLYRNNVIYVVLLWGGLTTNFIWCMILNARNKTFGDYTNKKTPLKIQLYFCCIGRYYLVPAILFLWHGRKQTGQWPQFMDTAHGVHHSGGKYVGNVLKEWKGVNKKTTTTIAIGIITIIFSVLLVGYGNYTA